MEFQSETMERIKFRSEGTSPGDAMNTRMIVAWYGMVMRFYLPNVRDNRWLPVARSMPGEDRAQSMERDAGSHSVDRIVRIIIKLV